MKYSNVVVAGGGDDGEALIAAHRAHALIGVVGRGVGIDAVGVAQHDVRGVFHHIVAHYIAVIIAAVVVGHGHIEPVALPAEDIEFLAVFHLAGGAAGAAGLVVQAHLHGDDLALPGIGNSAVRAGGQRRAKQRNERQDQCR